MDLGEKDIRTWEVEAEEAVAHHFRVSGESSQDLLVTSYLFSWCTKKKLSFLVCVQNVCFLNCKILSNNCKLCYFKYNAPI